MPSQSSKLIAWIWRWVWFLTTYANSFNSVVLLLITKRYGHFLTKIDQSFADSTQSSEAGSWWFAHVRCLSVSSFSMDTRSLVAPCWLFRLHDHHSSAFLFTCFTLFSTMNGPVCLTGSWKLIACGVILIECWSFSNWSGSLQFCQMQTHTKFPRHFAMCHVLIGLLDKLAPTSMLFWLYMHTLTNMGHLLSFRIPHVRNMYPAPLCVICALPAR